ncbi:MAG: ATP-dependent zinc metalloprotease FtsH [Thalassolituus maritimus]|uniref:ATP-dependent zinc metalloprotease FtsH n=1 Tax=Thalassolituus maritimus TaxID=484498 RepID=A0A1N7IZ96_9GAMM|nr:ATP-dependent zinc metalloprotease FtsH [Thalassolituus maritimus]TPD54118.1 MAG: ATP-dependent zinc metalloprotease FtsH [Thalassolituus maritimus]SIS42337.1 membrane protease FtsH catalytic subunit [Thalassolituus maritimus]
MAKNFVLWAVIAAVLMMVFQGLNPVDRSNSWSYSEFMKAVESGQVESVTISGQSIKGTSRGGQAFESVLPAFDDKLMDTLLVNDVEVIGEKPEKQSFLSQLLLASLPILIIIAVFMLFMRQMQGGGSGRGGPMAFGKSKAKLLSEDQIKTTFGDVAGCDEAKEDVKELVEFLREPGKYQKLGGKIPRGVLMVGQPGTGKTLLAKAIAGEARVPFFSISGSDFVEMFVGVGASRVRDMFEQAKKQAPCIIFIDEIDAVGRSRGVGIGGGNDEREQTLNQLLVEMDGFEVNDGIIVIAATNRPDVLDPALLRPGRFDRQVVVGLPDIRGREQILQVHMKKAPVSDDVNASLIARGTPGFSGADLANLVNEAALFAARANRSEVTMEEFEKAKDKILMGAERKTMVMSEKEKENTAYHEAGHAIVGRLVPEHDPVYKVSIIPRGRALGVTMFLPEEDRHSISKRGIESNICSLYGGRIAEELTLGKDGVTTGASNDIERATKYARNYVTKWGLSDKLGAQLYSEDEQNGYLGSSGGGQMAHLSDDTARSIDSEVKELLDRCYQRATQILVDNRDKLEMMKDALMEYETIDSDQIDDIMSGTKPRPPKGWGDGSGGSPAVSADDSVEKESRDMASDDDDVAGEPAGERQ